MKISKISVRYPISALYEKNVHVYPNRIWLKPLFYNIYAIILQFVVGLDETLKPQHNKLNTIF